MPYRYDEISRQRWLDVINVDETTIAAWAPVALFYERTTEETYTTTAQRPSASTTFPIQSNDNRIVLSVRKPFTVSYQEGVSGNAIIHYTHSHIGFNGPLAIKSGELGRCTWDCSPGIVVADTTKLSTANANIELGQSELGDWLFATAEELSGFDFAAADDDHNPVDVFRFLGIIFHPLEEDVLTNRLAVVTRYRTLDYIGNENTVAISPAVC